MHTISPFPHAKKPHLHTGPAALDRVCAHMRMRYSVCSHSIPNSPHTVPIKGGPTDSINYYQ